LWGVIRDFRRALSDGHEKGGDQHRKVAPAEKNGKENDGRQEHGGGDRGRGLMRYKREDIQKKGSPEETVRSIGGLALTIVADYYKTIETREICFTREIAKTKKIDAGKPTDQRRGQGALLQSRVVGGGSFTGTERGQAS